jgi:hypothetical protein
VQLKRAKANLEENEDNDAIYLGDGFIKMIGDSDFDIFNDLMDNKFEIDYESDDSIEDEKYYIADFNDNYDAKEMTIEFFDSKLKSKLDSINSEDKEYAKKIISREREKILKQFQSGSLNESDLNRELSKLSEINPINYPKVFNKLNPNEIKNWQKLVDKATEFYKLKPWKWMKDSEVFGVENPINGEIGFCTVMGYLGEYESLGVYLGKEGYTGLREIQENGRFLSPEDFLNIQSCLMVSFEDEFTLEPPDHYLLRKINRKFKKTKKSKQNLFFQLAGNTPGEFPKFREWKPSKYPWFLDQNQVRFLTIAIFSSNDRSKEYS